MTKFTARVGQAGDGTWTAAVIGQHTVLGTGDTRELAVENLKDGIKSLLQFLAWEGSLEFLALHSYTIEIVEVNV